MNSRLRALCAPAALCAALVASVGCGNMATRMMSPMLDDIGASLYRQTDLQLAKDGLPTFLLLLDGLVESDPDNVDLLLTAAQAYSAYAMAFVEDTDQARALNLYAHARRYAFRALWRNKALKRAWNKPYDDFVAAVAKVGKRDAHPLFWAANCWASWIICNTDSVDALADLPRVQCLMERAAALDETYQHGGPHLFLGVYHCARPKQLGGDPEKAKIHFDRAFQIAGNDYLMGKVYFAQYYARQVFDRALYEQTLKQVLAAKVQPDSDLALLNTVAQKRAKKLLEMTDEYF